ncbi:MAG: DNA translocase FtsK [Bacteroidales bacterium]|jgi:S-DNA-T family DNA segregation ATPase FtsK/SpoIIIE|nr:DNA translocase FtsK [Bacteroidales bacterium]
MAKSKKSKSKKKGNHLINHLKDERIKFILGLITILFGIYMALAFFSYFFTWKADQSFIWNKAVSASDIIAENWTGKYGAKLANSLILKGFGLSSFFVPFLIIIVGLRLFNIRKIPLRRTIRFSLYLMIITSIALGFILGTTGGYWGSGLGGEYGLFIAKWISSFIGKVGTVFFLIITTCSILIFSNRVVFDFAKKLINNLFGKNSDDNKDYSNNEFNDSSTTFTETNTLNNDISEKTVEEKIVEKPINSNNTPKDKNNTDTAHTLVIERPEEEEQVNDKITDEPELIVNDNDEIEFIPADTLVSENSDNGNNQPEKTDDENVSFEIAEKVEEEILDEKDLKTNEFENYDPTLDLPSYQVPPIELLDDHKSEKGNPTIEELEENKKTIIETLENYKIKIQNIKATVGPTVTLYEIVPAPGIRISKIKNLEDDIALSLAALGIRIIAPIPGKGTIGIEVPNPNPEIVSMKTIIKSAKFQNSKHDLAIALGKTVSSEIFTFDLAKTPHLLVAGATGQGKSVGLNAILASLLYKKHPSQIKFVMVDPKKVELTLFSKIEKHFLAKLPNEEEPIITDTQKVINTLSSLCVEMDSRYELLKSAHVRNIKEYNKKFINRVLNPEKGHRYLPYIVVVIDEFADLIMTAGKEVEMPIARLAQLARAIGIHLIIATQRPTTNIITGVIKANFPARIAFRVTSMIDSRTILDSPGANQLIGRGDMLFSSGSDITRIQCAFVDTPEIERITDFIGNQRGYTSALLLPEFEEENTAAKDVDLQQKDDLFEDAARLIVMQQQGSTSLIQRKFSIGYNRAGRIIDQLEAAGIVGPFEGSKARQVLIPDDYALEQFLNSMKNQN